jgi:hypothetical protein
MQIEATPSSKDNKIIVMPIRRENPVSKFFSCQDLPEKALLAATLSLITIGSAGIYLFEVKADQIDIKYPKTKMSLMVESVAPEGIGSECMYAINAGYMDNYNILTLSNDASDRHFRDFYMLKQPGNDQRLEELKKGLRKSEKKLAVDVSKVNETCNDKGIIAGIDYGDNY